MLQAQRQAESIKNSIIQNEMSINKAEQEIGRLQRDRRTTVQQQILKSNEVAGTIQQEIMQWRAVNSIPAPISGHVQYQSTIVAERPIQAGQIIGHIIPDAGAGYYITAQCTVDNVGKVQVGQRALVRFPAYPSKEYGTIRSSVSKLEVVPGQDANQLPVYDVIINLEDTLTTDYGVRLAYRPSLLSQVTIITEDRSLFDRVFDQLTSLLRANKPLTANLTD